MCSRPMNSLRIRPFTSSDVAGDSRTLRRSGAAIGNRVSLAGGPASMDNLLAGDISLMDRDQDLSLLPIPLLPTSYRPRSDIVS